MYISWGTKVFRRKTGIAADFCPICRRLAFVDVEEVRSQPHVYHIGIGEGKIVEHVTHCQICQSEWVIQAGTIRGAIHPAAYTTMDNLIAQTFPRFQQVHGERLRIEETLQYDPFALSQDTRISLLAEPFFVLENDVQSKGSKDNSWQSTVGSLGCLGSLGLAIAAIVNFFSGSIWMGFLMVALTVGAGWLGSRLIDAGTRQFMRRSIYPRLAHCLAPMRPTTEELQMVIANVDAKCAKQTDIQELLPLIEAARPPLRTPQPAVVQPPPVVYRADQ